MRNYLSEARQDARDQEVNVRLSAKEAMKKLLDGKTLVAENKLTGNRDYLEYREDTGGLISKYKYYGELSKSNVEQGMRDINQFVHASATDIIAVAIRRVLRDNPDGLMEEELQAKLNLIDSGYEKQFKSAISLIINQDLVTVERLEETVFYPKNFLGR